MAPTQRRDRAARPTMSDAEMRERIRRFQQAAADDEAGRAAAEPVVRAFLPTIQRMARRDPTSLAAAEMESAGLEALWHALLRYDLTSPTSFGAYFATYLRFALLHARRRARDVLGRSDKVLREEDAVRRALHGDARGPPPVQSGPGPMPRAVETRDDHAGAARHRRLSPPSLVLPTCLLELAMTALRRKCPPIIGSTLLDLLNLVDAHLAALFATACGSAPPTGERVQLAVGCVRAALLAEGNARSVDGLRAALEAETRVVVERYRRRGALASATSGPYESYWNGVADAAGLSVQRARDLAAISEPDTIDAETVADSGERDAPEDDSPGGCEPLVGLLRATTWLEDQLPAFMLEPVRRTAAGVPLDDIARDSGLGLDGVQWVLQCANFLFRRIVRLSLRRRGLVPPLGSALRFAPWIDLGVAGWHRWRLEQLRTTAARIRWELRDDGTGASYQHALERSLTFVKSIPYRRLIPPAVHGRTIHQRPGQNGAETPRPQLDLFG